MNINNIFKLIERIAAQLDFDWHIKSKMSKLANQNLYSNLHIGITTYGRT